MGRLFYPHGGDEDLGDDAGKAEREENPKSYARFALPIGIYFQEISEVGIDSTGSVEDDIMRKANFEDY